jgi:hypothetical protein
VERLGVEASKAGVMVIKRRAGAGRETPRLVVLTEAAWRAAHGLPAADAKPPGDVAGSEPRATEAVPRPSPEAVAGLFRRLRQTGSPVRLAALARALQNETGCSRAGAYRAVADAVATGTITRS